MNVVGAAEPFVVEGFFAEAARMRESFTERFATPFALSRDRFVWDYWHVPGQYTYLRTFARTFFAPNLYWAFIDRLSAWGQATLGCSDVMEPWLSYYVDGCRQAAHTDAEHGPWAYVFSLTDWEHRDFTGGETFVTLTGAGDTRKRIAAHMNRLIVFDPRLEHGVETVRGTHDPLRARVVLHGWFRTPPLSRA